MKVLGYYSPFEGAVIVDFTHDSKRIHRMKLTSAETDAGTFLGYVANDLGLVPIAGGYPMGTIVYGDPPTPTPKCSGCGNEVWPEMCYCGIEEASHGLETHTFTPVGCICGYSKASDV